MHAADAIFICMLSILIYFFEEGEGCILLACFLIHLFLMVPCHLVLSEVLGSPFPFFPCIIATSHSRFFCLPPQTLSSSAGPTFLHCPSAPLSSSPLPRPWASVLTLPSSTLPSLLFLLSPDWLGRFCSLLPSRVCLWLTFPSPLGLHFLVCR